MKKNLPLLIGCFIPIGFIIITACLLINTDNYSDKPTYNFIFTNSPYFYSYSNYQVIDGKITMLKKPNQNDTKEKLYLYDVANNQYKIISLARAQNLQVISTTKSPDGFAVIHGQTTEGFIPFLVLFSAPNYQTYYLQKKTYTSKLNLPKNINYHFIGWIAHG